MVNCVITAGKSVIFCHFSRHDLTTAPADPLSSSEFPAAEVLQKKIVHTGATQRMPARRRPASFAREGRSWFLEVNCHLARSRGAAVSRLNGPIFSQIGASLKKFHRIL